MKNDKINPALKMPTPAKPGGTTGSSLLKKILIDFVKDIYWAENQLIKSLPLLQQNATTPELQMILQEHVKQTENHVIRLEQIFSLLAEKPQGKESRAMTGLIEEAKIILEETSAGTMSRDASIIMAAQKIEHYEIATYGCLLEFSRTLGLKEIAGLLHATLDEEKQADQGLTVIAQTGINWEAEDEHAEEKSITF